MELKPIEGHQMTDAVRQQRQHIRNGNDGAHQGRRDDRLWVRCRRGGGGGRKQRSGMTRVHTTTPQVALLSVTLLPAIAAAATTAAVAARPPPSAPPAEPFGAATPIAFTRYRRPTVPPRPRENPRRAQQRGEAFANRHEKIVPPHHLRHLL